MIFEQIATGGCQSYLVGCPDTCAGVLIDPELRQIDRYLASAARDGLRIRYCIDTHTHADHFSATRELAARLDVPVVMHTLSPAPFASLRVNDGDMLAVGNLRLQFIHTPGHTRDSTCIHVGRSPVHRRHAADRRARAARTCRPATPTRSTTACSTAS